MSQGSDVAPTRSCSGSAAIWVALGGISKSGPKVSPWMYRPSCVVMDLDQQCGARQLVRRVYTAVYLFLLFNNVVFFRKSEK